MKKWIQPHWGDNPLGAVRTIAVQNWLRGLRRADGTPLANPTKAKIRNLFSVLFNHAIRYEWLEQGRNPITLVRQSAQRKSTQRLWTQMRSRPPDPVGFMLPPNGHARCDNRTPTQ